MKKVVRLYLIVAAQFLIAAAGSLLLVVDTGGFKPLQEIETGAWTIHTYAGLFLFIFFMLIVLVPQLITRVPVVKNAFSRIASRFEISETVKIKWWTMVVLSASAVYAYTYCHHLCDRGGIPIFDCEIHFFHMFFRFTLSLFPYFIGGCIVGGFIMKYLSASRFKLPTTMLGAGIFAAIIPVCSCGAVPLVRAMLATGQIRVRTVITFLMIAPVLSPVVIPFSFELGLPYAITRIIAIFVLAMIVGIIIERLAGVKEEGGRGAAYSCKGCAVSSRKSPTTTNSVLIAGWDIMLFLLPYIVIGIVIGALIAKYVPASLVGTYLSSDFVGLITSTSISLPLFLCAGQEIVILAPLMNVPLMGVHAVPLGHAIAFTIAGTGICLSAIPALVPTIGKRAVAVLVASFWIGSVILGLIINYIMRLPFL
ncbi:permease [Chloroflexota bacterium]